MLNEMNFSALLAMQGMLPFFSVNFEHYKVAVISFQVVKYIKYFSFVWFNFEF